MFVQTRFVGKAELPVLFSVSGNQSAYCVLFGLISVVAGYMLIKAFSDSLLVFGMPEVDLLFPTPVSRRDVVGFKLVQLCLKSSFYIFLLVYLFMPIIRLLDPNTSYLSMWLALFFVVVILINTSTAINLIATYRGGVRWWFSWVVRILVLGVGSLTIVLFSSNYRLTHDPVTSFLVAVSLPVLRLVFMPVEWVTTLAFAQPALADYVGAVKADKEALEKAFKAPGYSPYAGRNFPTMVL